MCLHNNSCVFEGYAELKCVCVRGGGGEGRYTQLVDRGVGCDAA